MTTKNKLANWEDKMPKCLGKHTKVLLNRRILRRMCKKKIRCASYILTNRILAILCKKMNRCGKYECTFGSLTEIRASPVLTSGVFCHAISICWHFWLSIRERWCLNVISLGSFRREWMAPSLALASFSQLSFMSRFSEIQSQRQGPPIL